MFTRAVMWCEYKGMQEVEYMCDGQVCSDKKRDLDITGAAHWRLVVWTIS